MKLFHHDLRQNSSIGRDVEPEEQFDLEKLQQMPREQAEELVKLSQVPTQLKTQVEEAEKSLEDLEKKVSKSMMTALSIVDKLKLPRNMS